MAKRHNLDPTSFPSIALRLQELVAANSGADVFDEVFRLIIAKIASESTGVDWAICCDRANPERSKHAFDTLLAKAASIWPNVVPDSPSELSNDHLTICSEAISHVNISNSGFDILDHVFEYLISSNSKGALGQFFTPRHVVDFCVRLACPKPNETILDPACGSGAFLLHSLRHLHSTYNDGNTGSNLWGFDFSHRASLVARAMMQISGATEAHIVQLNSLVIRTEQVPLPGIESTDPALTIDDVLNIHNVRRGFDLIVTNPPFAGEIVDEKLLENYTLATGKSRIERDCLFLERCIKLLRPGGRMVIVLPHNKFGGQQYASLRSWLFLQAQVVAIVSLDRNAFAPHTHQKTNILLCRRRPTPLRKFPQNEHIFFGLSEFSGRDSSGRDRIVDESEDVGTLNWRRVAHDLAPIEKAFRSFLEKHNIAW